MASIRAIYILLVMSAYVSAMPEPAEEQGDAFEGDILLTPEQQARIDAIISAAGDEVAVRKANANLDERWPDATMPYEISDTSIPNTDIIKKALDYWESNTCLTFPPYDSAVHVGTRVRFKQGVGCSSWVGMVGYNPQDISIGWGCEDIGTVCHEIAHAFGFWHEQSRTDRDEYVEIHLENVQDGRASEFVKHTDVDVNAHNVPYDYGSCMQYGPKAFSRNDLDTITALDAAFQDDMGQRTHISAADVLLANIMYGCSGPKFSTRLTYQYNTLCLSPYKVNSLASLAWAQAALATTGETGKYWVDGQIQGNTISFGDGTTMPVSSALFHNNEPNGGGDCLQLWNWGAGWKLDDTTCSIYRRYMCAAMPVVDAGASAYAVHTCASGQVYQITDERSLEHATIVLRTNGELTSFWVDGQVSDDTITFTGGSSSWVYPDTFHAGEPSYTSGNCLQLWYNNGEWKLDDVSCSLNRKHLCVG